MVHPTCWTACGIDPDVYQGFRLCMGVGPPRLCLKYGMPDLRDISRLIQGGSALWIQTRWFRRALKALVMSGPSPLLPISRQTDEIHPILWLKKHSRHGCEPVCKSWKP